MRRFPKIKLLACCVLSVGFHSCSTSQFFYNPDKEILYYPDTAKCRYEEVNFKASDGNTIIGWFIKPKNDTVKITATILFVHANGRNMGYQLAPLLLLAQHGFQGLVFDYEGYGKSEGNPSQEKILDDAIKAMDYIINRNDVKNTKLILFGQSLGAHLACVLGGKLPELYHGKTPIDAFVEEEAFTGHKDIAAYHSKKDYFIPGFIARWMVPSKYNAIDYIDKISVPKLIIHSTEDEVCPFYMGKELFEKAKNPKQFWEVKGEHISCCRLYPDEFVKQFQQIAAQK